MFGEAALAYTDVFTTPRDAARLHQEGFTIEIALRLAQGGAPGFGVIAVVHRGEDRSQLLIAQWRRWVIVMNGDDYDHRRKSPRLTASFSDDRKVMFIAIRSDPSGAVMYVDGKAAAAHPGLALRLPTDHEEGRLVLGNNIYGSSGWRGQILGFALHLDALSEGALRNHFEAWRRGDGFAGDGYRSAQVAYPFSERQGRKALDRSANGLALNFPNETTGLAPQFFEPLTKGLRRGDVRDIIINIGGFIPFGFFLAALFGRATPVGRLTTVGVAMTIGFTLSFGIEFAQAWMPSRSSSLLDLLLNTAGSGLGGSAFALLLRRGPPGW